MTTTTDQATYRVVCPDHQIDCADHDAAIAALATVEDQGACIHQHTIVLAEGPAIIDPWGCIPCGHGTRDLAGYVVAYSHLAQDNAVTFTDIAWFQDAALYTAALALVREARRKVYAGEVDATYAVIHHVYRDGHRHA